MGMNSYDSGSGTLTVKAVFNEKIREHATRYFGNGFLGMSIHVDENVPEMVMTGKIYPIQKNLYNILFRHVPADTCEKIVEALNLGDFYSIGLIWQEQLFGNMTFGLPNGKVLTNASLIEIYAQAASIALQRRVAEDALKESDKKRAEDALKNSENYLLKIFNSTQSGLVVIDPETHTIFDANSTAAELIGTEKSSIVGSSCKKWFCPAENEPCPVMDLGQQIVRSEGVLNNVNGEKRSIIKTVVPVQLGGREYLLESFVDITERKKAEEALRESEERFRLLVESAPIGIGFSDSHTAAIDYLNPEFVRILGYTLEENSNMITLFEQMYPDPEYRKKLFETWMGDMSILGGTNTYSDNIFRVRCKDGTDKDLWFRVVHFTNGKALTIIEDFTERKRAEEALRASEERFRLLVESAPIGIVFSDSHTAAIDYVNPEFEKVLGYTLEENSNMFTWFEQMYPDPEYRKKLYEDWMDDLRRLAGTNAYAERTLRARCKDGTDKDIWSRVVHFANGKALTTFEDITERKRAEEALRASEKRFQDLAEMLPQNIWECDNGGNVTFVNHRGCEMYGYTYEDVEKGMTIWQTIHPDDRERVIGDFIQALTQEPREFPEFHEFMSIRKDGSTFPLITYHVPIVHENKITGMRGIGIDISERKHAEVALKASEERFRLLVESVPFGISFLTSTGIIEYANPAFEKICGYTREEIPDLTIWGENVFPDAEYREKIFGTWLKHIQTLIGTNLHADNIFRIHCRDGKDKDIRIRAVFFANGKVLVTIEDFTERKRAEETIHECGIRLNSL
ncbi:MAG: PAS domain S-box protein [Methanoregula sp.]|nr:PAS domain S-box protein [Methanoregula sp.]